MCVRGYVERELYTELDSNRTVFTFCSWFDLLGAVLSFYISILKSGHIYSAFLSKGDLSFQDYVSGGISHPVFYSNLVNKPKTVKGAVHVASSGSKII